MSRKVKKSKRPSGHDHRKAKAAAIAAGKPLRRGGKRRNQMGRPVGSANKDWPSVRAILGEVGLDPARQLAELARNRRVPPAVRARCAAELCRYVWPTLSAVQVSGPDGKPIQHEDAGRPDVAAARAKLRGELPRLDTLVAPEVGSPAGEPASGPGVDPGATP